MVKQFYSPVTGDLAETAQGCQNSSTDPGPSSLSILSSLPVFLLVVIKGLTHVFVSSEKKKKSKGPKLHAS